MVVDVKRIINAPGERIDFRFDLDLSDVDFGGLYPAQNPVVVTGNVRNTAEMLLLSFTAGTVLKSVCDRCLKTFDNPRQVSCEYMLAQQVENGDSDEIVLLEDGAVDVGELAGRRSFWRWTQRPSAPRTARGCAPAAASISTKGAAPVKRKRTPDWQCWPSFWRRILTSKKILY